MAVVADKNYDLEISIEQTISERFASWNRVNYYEDRKCKYKLKILSLAFANAPENSS